ncbi:Hypothetical protein PP7435_CHR3-0133 [Komagataella phaffii CBS 7435]|uniref:DUF1014-domain-containing protein n=2 Tax=Komagataella phaffii TaxID=460519 RepID=C4R6B1_KOMPG|nr:Hypothetical protein PAS_chr3_1034 [Komagataella phaffii GS115]AOA64347.1 GQ67_04165T0 [Komagataella phaffii]CAH2449063.1 Hypothetical protein BQ9382_C3-0775 [Komagataella phaffii CBS 7435]AOA69303.1 GQ68_04138T0 [Komagataella phaffii GS115]CAY71097.1 Hypothetical protein PAS_chr3_1034 [Komagataella phaffii GS115]CCA39105.1 Hypothetical protein PP7435_CHR3-0133 [Komagataella phaffii CBS 7435]
MAKKGKKSAKEPQEDVQSEEEDWESGSKKVNAKKSEKDAKKAEELRKKQEREALLKQEEELISAKAKKSGKNAKNASKKGGIDDAFNDFNKASTIDASGISDALGALDLLKSDAGVSQADIDRHPERRVKAAYAAFQERRIPELKLENPGLRKQQLENLCYKEFQKSPENPMNGITNVSYNAKEDEIQNLKFNVKKQKEKKYQR